MGCLQEMQPAEANADPAEWAEGQQPSSQPAESHGSAPSAGAPGRDADTADSAGAGAGLAAEADGSVGTPAGSAAAEEAGPGGDLQNMQIEPPEHELESSLLEKGNILELTLLCWHAHVLQPRAPSKQALLAICSEPAARVAGLCE